MALNSVCAASCAAIPPSLSPATNSGHAAASPGNSTRGPALSGTAVGGGGAAAGVATASGRGLTTGGVRIDATFDGAAFGIGTTRGPVAGVGLGVRAGDGDEAVWVT